MTTLFFCPAHQKFYLSNTTYAALTQLPRPRCITTLVEPPSPVYLDVPTSQGPEFSINPRKELLMRNRRRSCLDELVDDVPVLVGVVFVALLVAAVVVLGVRAI